MLGMLFQFTIESTTHPKDETDFIAESAARPCAHRSVRLDQERPIESCAIVLHRRGCRQLNQLLGRKVPLCLSEYLVRDFRGSPRHTFSKTQSRPFAGREQVTIPEIRQSGDLVRRSASLAAPDSIGIHSKWATYHLRGSQAHQRPNEWRQFVAARRSGAEVAARFENGRTVGLNA